MMQKRWLGLKIAVFVCLASYIFYGGRMLFLLFKSPDNSGAPYYIDNAPFYIKWALIYAFFIGHQLLNAKLLRHNLPELIFPSKHFIHLHDFALIMDVSLLGYYLLINYNLYFSLKAVWQSQPQHIKTQWIINTPILLFTFGANIYTIIYSIKLRQYLKKEAAKGQETIIDSIGSNQQES